MRLDTLVQLILQVMLPIGLLVAAGALWPLLGGVGAATLRTELNRLVLYLFSPALVFSIAARTEITTRLLSVPFLVALALFITGLLLYVLLYRTRLGTGLRDETRAALLIAGIFGNLFFVGLPILTFLFGAQGASFVAYADNLAGVLLVWTLGVWLAVHLVPGTRAATPLSFWRVMSGLPPVWAFVIGALGHQFGVPFTPWVNAAHLIGQATVPVMMFVLGLSIPWRDLRPNKAVLSVVGTKLLVMPTIAWVFAWLMFAPLAPAHYAAIIEAAMPTMLMALLFADRFKLDVEVTALTIGWSTVLFWFTLPAWLWWLAPPAAR